MGKIFFNKLKFLTFYICAILVSALFCLSVALVYAQKQISYKTYDPQTGEVSNRLYALVEDIPSGGYKIHWVIEGNGFKVEEDYILGPDHETLWWHVVDDQRKTDYTGERKRNEIFIDGQFSGARIQKIIQIDKKAFYYNPKFGLVNFVRSGKEAESFWGFRQDELKVYPMKAVNKGQRLLLLTEAMWRLLKSIGPLMIFGHFFSGVPIGFVNQMACILSRWLTVGNSEN